LFDRKIQTRRGVKGIAVAAVHNTTLWVVVICTGIGVGIIGAWLDILVAWSCYLLWALLVTEHAF
jgi:chloride channel 3/4/5